MARPTTDQARAILERAINAAKQFDQRWDQLNVILGMVPESPLSHAVYTLHALVLSQAGALLGDECEWLEWFVYENDYGAKWLEAESHGEGLHQIRTLDDLLELLGYTPEKQQ